MEGWEISGITVAESGNPAQISFSPDVLGLGGGTNNRPNLVVPARGPKTQKQWFNTAAFAAPVAAWLGGRNQGFGNAGKDAVVAPGLFIQICRYSRRFRFRRMVEPLSNSGLSPSTLSITLNSKNIDTGFTDSAFGQVTSTYDPRVLQFGAKLLF
jgi:hypothetical protein